jgi:alanine racemase
LKPEEIAWAEVDLDAVAHNVRAVKQFIGEGTALMAVVKGNAYGHGLLPVARVALENGATRLAVARVAEGVELRAGGVAAPIVVLGFALPEQAPHIVRGRLAVTVNTLEMARALSAAVVEQGASDLPVHVKVDTGLGRFGLLPEEVPDFCRALRDVPHLRLEGLWTHFACADEADPCHTHDQLAVYHNVRQCLEDEGIDFPLHHVANSGATLTLPETHLDAVRCGIVLYGLRPSAEVKSPFPLRPAMSIKARVARLRTLPAGCGISYNRLYVTTRSTAVALIPLGYADGYRRGLTNKGQVLIRGQRAPIIGRVCMDQFMVDVSGIPAVQEGDEVVLLGCQGRDEINAEELGSWVGTNNYETVTALLPRLPRVYVGGAGQ